jgi:hypothetical protein
MSVEINLFPASTGFSNYSATSPESKALFSPLSSDSLTDNSRIGVEFIYEGTPIQFLIYGDFVNASPGISFMELTSLNENSIASKSELYINNVLVDSSNYLTPVTVRVCLEDTIEDTMTLYSGDDVISAPKLNDREGGGISFFGYNGNDRFYAYGSHQNDDIFFGGDGTDTLIYSSSIANFSVTQSGFIWNPSTEQANANGYFIRDNSGRDGDVQISEVERIVFSDSAIAFDTTGTAGQAYRIYEAVLGRAPDLEGLGYWINDMDNGVSLTTVASGFIASTEFQSQYGANPSYETYLNLLYNNILNRAPDAEGLDYWLSNMRSGANSPAVVLASFSEGIENKTNVAPDIADGIYYTAWIT